MELALWFEQLPKEILSFRPSLIVPFLLVSSYITCYLAFPTLKRKLFVPENQKITVILDAWFALLQFIRNHLLFLDSKQESFGFKGFLAQWERSRCKSAYKYATICLTQKKNIFFILNIFMKIVLLMYFEIIQSLKSFYLPIYHPLNDGNQLYSL